MSDQVLLLAPVDALVVYCCYRASRRTVKTPWLRQFWIFLTLAWAAELTADLILVYYDVGLGDPTFPSPADFFYLIFYPLVMLALLRLPNPRATRSQRLRSTLDCATIVVGGGAVIWYFVLGRALTAGVGSTLERLVSIAYPIGDLVLLCALTLVLLRGVPPVLRSPLWLITAGLGMLIVADTIYGHQQLLGTYSPGDPVDVLYVLLAFPFALAAVSQRQARSHDDGGVPNWDRAEVRVSRLPLLALVGGVGVLLATEWNAPFFPDFSLLIFVLVLGILTVGRQFLAQRELLQVRGRVRMIVESVADGIVVFGEDGRVVWVNPAAELAFQAEPGELEGTPVDRLFHGVAWADMSPLLGVGVKVGPTVIGRRRTLTGERRDGGTFPLEMVVTDALLDGERVFIAIGQDVGERERTAGALRESERRFRGIFDHAGVGIAFSAFEDGRPRIVDVNSAFSQTVGYSVEELRGDDFSLITYPEDLGALAEMGSAVAGGEDYIAREMRCRRKDGVGLWGSLTVSVLRGDDGTPLFAVGMLEDITRRKEAERVKDEFVSVVGHELRTPLTSIRGSLGLLEGGVMGELPEQANQMLATAVSNTDRLVRLINDILDIERIDSGRADLEPARVAAAAVVEHSLQAVQGVAAEAGVSLRTAVGDVAVAADADRVVQALINLLGNAIKFSEPGGAVEVTVAAEGDRGVFSVRDDGRGIPADQLDSIFERFQQVDASDAREKGGTGLGLAIARSIIEQHGGEIWAENGESGGAIFRFTLPLAAGDASPVGNGRPG